MATNRRVEKGKNGIVSLKLARLEMEEMLLSDPGFVVMGENTEGNRLIVYSRWPVMSGGLPIVYKGWGVDEIDIASVRHTVSEQQDYERRQGSER